MILTDTHTHLYLDNFNEDREQTIKKAIDQNVKYMFLPNIDSDSIEDMLNLCRLFPNNCFPMIGLHPTSVKDNYKEELSVVDRWLSTSEFIAIGETGIDLYWDKTHAKEQEIAFRHQIELALLHKLPIVIHSRNSIDRIIDIVNDPSYNELQGVFHCFPGTLEHANTIIELGYKIGIGGVVTFKNSNLKDVIEHISLEHILLETDSPFLAPAPHRGKRNESAYINIIAKRIAEIRGISLETVAKITTQNSIELFNLTKLKVCKK